MVGPYDTQSSPASFSPMMPHSSPAWMAFTSGCLPAEGRGGMADAPNSCPISQHNRAAPSMPTKQPQQQHCSEHQQACAPVTCPMVSAVSLTMAELGLGAQPGYASSCGTV